MKNYREESYDIVIVGGGFSGVAVAIAAAREGAKVLLADKNGSLGGSASCASVLPFMKFWYFPDSEHTKESDRIYINNGIFREILDEMKALGAYSESEKYFIVETLKLVMDRLCKKYGVTVLFHAYLFDAESDGRTVTAANFATQSGVYTAKARIFIDASGDGQLAFLSGCSFKQGRDEDGLCQPITTNFRVTNIDYEKGGGFAEVKRLTNEAYKKAKEEGKLINPRENVLFFKTFETNSVSLNATRITHKDPTDPFDLSEAEAVAREQMLEILDIMKNNVPGCENAIISHSGPDIGIRESRRINGDYELTAEDLMNCVNFEDSIAAGSYEIDIHNPSGTGTHIQKLPVGAYYHIPYRSLIAKDKDNLLVVGRCISSTHEAQSAYRIMPIVSCIGEGGGVAAGLALKTGKTIRSVDISEVRRKLCEEYGATI